MSTDYNVYVGPYLIVIDSVMTIREDVLTCGNDLCPQHGRELPGGRFCAQCGRSLSYATKEFREPIDLYTIFEEELGDWDIMERVVVNGRQLTVFIVPNDTGQGGRYPDVYGECVDLGSDDAPNLDVLRPQGDDWARVCDALDKRGIKYKRSSGVLTWTS